MHALNNPSLWKCDKYIIVRLIHWIETPLFRYLVFSDPPGAKIGNGGATMHALEQLEMVIGWEQLEKGTVTVLLVLLQ